MRQEGTVLFRFVLLGLLLVTACAAPTPTPTPNAYHNTYTDPDCNGHLHFISDPNAGSRLWHVGNL